MHDKLGDKLVCGKVHFNGCLITENSGVGAFISCYKGKGQRRSAAVHIVDAVILGGKDVRSKHYHERYSEF